METFSALDLTKQTDGEKYWQQEAERAPKQDRSVQRAVTPQALAPQLQREQSGTAELGSGMQQHPTAGTGREKRGLASPHAARGFNRSLDSICVSHQVNWASKGGRRKQQVCPVCRRAAGPRGAGCQQPLNPLLTHTGPSVSLQRKPQIQGAPKPPPPPRRGRAAPHLSAPLY